MQSENIKKGYEHQIYHIKVVSYFSTVKGADILGYKILKETLQINSNKDLFTEYLPLIRFRIVLVSHGSS